MSLEQQIEHQRLVEKAYNLVKHEFGRYEHVWKNFEYKLKDGAGECDLLTYHKSGLLTYYEIKIHQNKHSYEHAIEQFRRFKKTHPLVRTRFVYWTPTCVKRVYVDDIVTTKHL